MISSEHELRLAHEALGDLYRAIASLKAQMSEANPKAFTLLAEGPLHEIERIQGEIELFTGVALARLEQAPLWLRLVGPRARWGETPSSVLTAFLDALRKGIQSIASFNNTGRVGGRPSAELQRACDMELVNFAPGSFQVGIRLPMPEQGEIFPDTRDLTATLALTEFLSAAEWAASSSSIDALTSVFQDAPKRRIVLRAIKAFVPRSHGGIDVLELSGSAVPSRHTVHLTPPATLRILSALESAISHHEQKYEGEIREMDLDRQTFKLRNIAGIGEVSCHFGDELYSSTIELLGKRVRVIGTQKSTDGVRGVLEVVDLERVDQRLERP